MDYELIIGIVSFVISVALSIVTVIIKIKSSKKEVSFKEIMNELIETMKIDDVCLDKITEAENTFSKIDESGETKKEVVLTKINQKCIEVGIPFNVEYWTERLKKLISLTKNVNKK